MYNIFLKFLLNQNIVLEHNIFNKHVVLGWPKHNPFDQFQFVYEFTCKKIIWL